MRKHVGPRSHIFKRIAENIWQCAYCNGYVVSKTQPSNEAFAKSTIEEAKRKAAAKVKE